MQAIILAAGMGKRLGSLTEDQTKCMIPFGDGKLIDYLMESLEEVKLNRIIIVTGYKGQGIIDHLGDEYKGTPIIYVDNPVYDSTNNIYSLYLAKDYLLEDDCLLLESDLIFDKKIIKDLVASSNRNLAVVAPYESWMDGTLVTLDKDHNILNFIPKEDMNWEKIKKYYKTVNVYKFTTEFMKQSYIPFLEAYIKSMGHNEYYEQVLRIIAFIEQKNLKAHVLKKEKWYEIDDVHDLRKAEEIFTPKEEALESIQKRYGGYWEYPELKDFCYLVNPYFPTPRMLNEFRFQFKNLVSHYPAGLNVQNNMAAALFGCGEKQILTGNGAAELIPPLMSSLKGKIGMMYPCFNEYPARIAEDKLVKGFAKAPSFHYGMEELRNLSKDCDTLLLVNPDNPSGNYLSQKEVLQLCKDLAKEGKFLVVDESFIDFSDEGEDHSLIDEKLLLENPNLAVVKSISKSYGVPGFRLGVLASSDDELLKEVRSKLPIWNINSFGEYFLQIMGKYRRDYRYGCEKQKKVRGKFIEDLKSITWLDVYPSQANYLLCKVNGKMSSTQLTNRLFQQNLLIKDLSDKEGFNGENYIRLAVRNKKDNRALVEALKLL